MRKIRFKVSRSKENASKPKTPRQLTGVLTTAPNKGATWHPSKKQGSKKKAK